MKPYRFRMLLFVLLCFSGFSGNAQSWKWVTHNNFAPRDFINMVTDQNGYIYASGYDNMGGKLTKYKPDGTMIWSKMVTTGAVQNLTVDSSGYLYITASSGQWPFWAFDFTAKLDTAGNELWAKGIHTPFGPTDLPTASLYAGATDPAGNTYMSGNFQNISYLTYFDTIALGSLAANNYYLAKYNSAGKIQWLRFYNDPVYAIASGPQGSYFIECGTFFQKYGANDSLIWQQDFSGILSPSMHLFPTNTLKSDGLGNLYVVGDNIAKYNASGALVWSTNNQNKSFEGKDFSFTNSGDIVVTGSFMGSLSLGNGLPDLTSTSTGRTLFVAQFSGVDGSAMWAKSASTTGWNSGDAVVSLPNGDCVVAGNSFSGSTFDQLSFAGDVFFVAELSSISLGISENSNTISSFQLYPNPATSKVTISNPDLRNASIEVFDVAGKKVLAEVYPSEGSMNVSTENWPAGLYVVKVVAKGKVYNQKFIVLH